MLDQPISQHLQATLLLFITTNYSKFRVPQDMEGFNNAEELPPSLQVKE